MDAYQQMTVGQYLILAAIAYPATFLLCYQFIYKPAKRKLNERLSVQYNDTDSISSMLYRVEEKQVLVIPTEYELSVSGVKIKRMAEGLIIYPAEKTWAEYSEIFKADSACQLTADKNCDKGR